MSCVYEHVVVTGASSGIGRATALRLAQAGWHVYAGVRRPEDGQVLARAGTGALTPLRLDVTDAEQISAAVDTIDDHVGAAGLNGLIDNAGIGVAWPLELVPLQALRRQFEVNVFGQIAVTQAFLPLLRQGVGRIVIGSIGDRITLPFAGPLAASKCAIGSLTDALRQELVPWGIRVVLLALASIHSDAVEQAGTRCAQGGRRISARGCRTVPGELSGHDREGSRPGTARQPTGGGRRNGPQSAEQPPAPRPLSGRQGRSAACRPWPAPSDVGARPAAPQDLSATRTRLPGH